MRTLLAFVALAALAGGIPIVVTGDDPPSGLEWAVSVRAGGCYLAPDVGSGYIVGPDLVLTSAHVVSGATEISVEHDGITTVAFVDVIDEHRDIAILRGEFPRPDVAAIGRAALGAPVLLALPEPSDPISARVARRLLVTTEDIYRQGRHDRQAIELDVAAARGASGAVVLDPEGTVAGVVYATSRGRAATFAVDADVVRETLARADGRTGVAGRCV